jgi:prepilin-type N-terminal cleavage/methylation domain-containing protein
MLRKTPRSSSCTGSAGFSLVELVVVMSIAAILSATIAPRFFTLQTFSERGYADELAAALRSTQKAAVGSGCAARLTLAAGGYAAAQQAASGNGCLASDNTWSTVLLGADGTTIQGAPPSGTSATPLGVYQFDAQGRLASSPGTTLSVGAHSITIDAGSGYVQVQ